MNALAPITNTVLSLPALVDRAVTALSSARTSAEVLEARDLASIAYDVAKKAARLGKAKKAHDSLIAAAHRSQADALEIEAGAKRRLADEYDAAQERGEINNHGGDRKTIKFEASKLEAIKPEEIHEGRTIRDAENADPGIVKRTLDEAIEAGDEPTRAKVKRAVKAKSNRKRRVKYRADPNAVAETQHDRDLKMLMGVWEASCPTAREAFMNWATTQ